MSPAPFLIPIENQVRELDAKLLLACFAADRGRDAYIGFKGAIDGRIDTFPRGVYLAKSTTIRSVKILEIARLVGHSVVAWDEEAVVHFPPEIYYQRRVSTNALCLIDLILAWGADNKALVEGYSEYPGTPVDVVGNPRVDLLRPEFRSFYDDEVASIKERYGDFVLFNTNFGSVNGFYPGLNVCYPDQKAPDGLALGSGAVGFSREFALELYRYRKNNFETMKALVPEVAKAFPDRTIIVRPHPSENRDTWREHLTPHENVHVTAEGSVVPWLLASTVLIHNSCTTGIESYVLERPAIAYIPASGANEYGSDLPNQVSHLASDCGAVIEKIQAAINGGSLPAQDADRTRILEDFITALNGKFATDRIVDTVEQNVTTAVPSIGSRIRGSMRARMRRFSKLAKSTDGSGRYGLAFKQQKFPDLTVSTVQAKADRLAQLAALSRRIQVKQVFPDIFQISAA